MSQDTYKVNPDLGFAGLEQGIGDRFARAFVNKSEIIPFGRGVVKEASVEGGIKLPSASSDKFEGIALAARGEQTGDRFELNKNVPVLKRGSILVQTEQEVTDNDDVYLRFSGKSQVQTIAFSTDLVASNKINLKIDIKAMTEITFATDHATTMAAIAAQILANFPQIATCTLGGTNNRTLTLTHVNHGVEFLISNVVVTAGASQATATITETVVPVSNDDRGKFRKDSDSSTAVKLDNVKFRKNSVNGLVEIDINIV